MPISYKRDDALRCVRLTVEGAVQMDNVSAVSLRRRDDGTWMLDEAEQWLTAQLKKDKLR
jgi:hypothetical protein